MSVASTMLDLGTRAPKFELPDVVTGETVSLGDFSDSRALLVMFICRHCPYVQHVKEELARLGEDYPKQQLGIVAISSNDPDQYPDDSPGSLREMAEQLGLNYPLLFDETQEVADAYRAACTPDFFLFGDRRELVYRGQLDDSRPGNEEPVTGEDLRGAIDDLLAGETVDPDQTPSAGCSIKWKPGNEPDWWNH